MTTSLVTSLHTETDMCFAKTPSGELFMVNGIDRGRKWNGSPDGSAVVIGLDAPTSAPTVTTPAGGGAEAGDYLVAYRFGDEDGNYSNLSPTATVTAVASDKFSWDTVGTASGTDSSARVTKRQLFRSLVGATDILYLVTTIADNSTTSYTTDTETDDQLADNEELPILNDDDTLNANRFSVPPTTKKVCIWNQDRMFYLADAYYSTGTVTVTNGSATVTGSGTSFNQYMVGRMLYPVGSTKGLLISAYTSTTSITISANYGGTTLTGVAYEIRPAPGDINTIFFSEADEPESVPQSQNKFVLQQNGASEDRIVGGYSAGPTLYIAQRYNTYSFNYTRQPHLDGRASLLFRRGLCNQQCSDIGDDLIFAMDQYGPYAVAGSGKKDIGEPIADYFRDGGVDFTYINRFFVRVNPKTKTAKFYVALTGDSGVKSCFAYNYVLDRWWVETYPWIVGTALSLNQSGEYKYYVGKEDDQFCVENYLVAADGLSTATSGVVSSSDADTIVATASIFTTSHPRCPIVFTSGTAKHQRCVITTRNSATSVDVNAVPSGVAAGDTFVVCGIPWSMKTGILTYQGTGGKETDSSISVTFKPTTNDGTYLDIRRYLNHATTPENYPIDRPEKEDRVGCTAGYPDGTATLYRSKNDLNETVGTCHANFAGRGAGPGNIDKFVSVEVRGVTNGEAIELSQIDVAGAK